MTALDNVSFGTLWINQFSAMLPEIGRGEVSTNGRKRKFARDGKWIYTSAANFRILGLVDIIILK